MAVVTNKYIVYVLEIHQVEFEVDAADENEAIKKAENGDGRWIDDSMEFVDSVGSDHWIVELLEDEVDTIPLDSNGREAYTLNKIKELQAILKNKAKNDSNLKELTESALAELKEELKLIRSEAWASLE